MSGGAVIAPGTELDGRYRIVRLLGEGAMGAVYEAEHTAVGRRVAIKVLHPHFVRAPDAVRRFAREAKAAAEIGHENIVEVFDVGTHEGAPFLVMELLRGRSLGERLANGAPVETREACSILGHVLSALASTHAKGIIHRDLKPDNVFLAEHGGAPVVKLLDFGVSKFRPSNEAIHETTQEGVPIGTPAYMAPEQWMGRRDIDHRADLFAVGVMLYELLTGGMPYEGASQGELFLEIVRGTDAPPAPSAIAPGVPEAIDAVVLRALRRERDERFASAAEFLDALRPFGADAITAVDLAPAAVDAEPLTTPPRRATRNLSTHVDGPAKLRRAGAWALGASLVALLAVLARASLTPPPQPTDRPAVPVTAVNPLTPPPAPPPAAVLPVAPVLVAPLPAALPLAPEVRAGVPARPAVVRPAGVARAAPRRVTAVAPRPRPTTSTTRARPGVGALTISHEF